MNRKFKGQRPAHAAQRALRQAVIRNVVRPNVPIRVVPPGIRKAHNLMGKSKYNDAGNLFEQLATNLLATGERRAPQFYLQAGRARFMSGEILAGMSLLKVGLAALASSGNLQQVLLIGQRLMEELSQRGYNTEAQQIQDLLNQNLPAETMQAPVVQAGGTSSPEPRRVLPTNCPSCSGPLIPKELEWMDEITAECPYCGNGVRVEDESNEESTVG